MHTKKIVVFQSDDVFQYELEHLIEVFVIRSAFELTTDKEKYKLIKETAQYGLEIYFNENRIDFKFVADKVLDERTLFVVADALKTFKNAFKKMIYDLLVTVEKPLSKWGILIGIRPVKIVHELIDEGYTLSDIRKILYESYYIQPDKIELMLEIAEKEREYLYPVNQKSVSLYLCIPFCPTRCVYCSFPSNDLKKKGRYLPQYLERLIEEVQFAIEEIHKAGKYIDCIYVGGGTPTSLDASQLRKLFEAMDSKLDRNLLKEFTVEAGRPDTITAEKLSVMKSFGVDRICINPQTMNDATLIQIGRNHGAQDIVEVMQMAKGYNFKSINMDIILGLPGETIKDSALSIDKIIALNPENITIHTLSVKRASRLKEDIEHFELVHDKMVSEMLADAESRLRASDMTPYYMYRQKKMIGHLENVGYAKKGFESLYNMRIMEEKHTIIACGAGAVSKICTPEENRFERVANFKGLEDYLNRFDEVLEKKRIIKDN